MKSNLFRLDSRDLVKGLIVAVIGATLTISNQMLNEHGLDFASYDWNTIINVAFSAGIAYLSKNFLSDSNDRVLGSL